MSWLKDNWMWVVVPALLMVAIVILAVLFGPSEQDPHGYDLR